MNRAGIWGSAICTAILVGTVWGLPGTSQPSTASSKPSTAPASQPATAAPDVKTLQAQVADLTAKLKLAEAENQKLRKRVEDLMRPVPTPTPKPLTDAERKLLILELGQEVAAAEKKLASLKATLALKRVGPVNPKRISGGVNGQMLTVTETRKTSTGTESVVTAYVFATQSQKDIEVTKDEIQVDQATEQLKIVKDKAAAATQPASQPATQSASQPDTEPASRAATEPVH